MLATVVRLPHSRFGNTRLVLLRLFLVCFVALASGLTSALDRCNPAVAATVALHSPDPLARSTRYLRGSVSDTPLVRTVRCVTTVQDPLKQHVGCTAIVCLSEEWSMHGAVA